MTRLGNLLSFGWLLEDHGDKRFGQNFPITILAAKNTYFSYKIGLGYFLKKFGLILLKPPVANLIKHFTIVNYDARVVLTTNLPIL